MRARRSRRRLAAGLAAALAALGVLACGGGDEGGDGPGGGGARESLSVADVAAATRRIEAARDCPAVYDAGGALTARLLEREPLPDARDPGFEAALADADAAIGRKLEALRCTRRGQVCEEFAKRAKIERARLEC